MCVCCLCRVCGQGCVYDVCEYEWDCVYDVCEWDCVYDVCEWAFECVYVIVLCVCVCVIVRCVCVCVCMCVCVYVCVLHMMYFCRLMTGHSTVKLRSSWFEGNSICTHTTAFLCVM